jgi:hypothetical protein
VEVGGGGAAARELGPHAAVRGQQRVVAEAGPVAADVGGEGRARRGVDRVVDVVRVGVGEPFDVGAEARLAGEVERQVHAEAAVGRRRIDQARERRAAAQREVAALRELERRHAAAGKPCRRAATACACRPAALTIHAASSSSASAPPVDDLPSGAAARAPRRAA